MTTHSKLSPSKRHRWGKCPGSIRMCEGIPEKGSNKAAIDGTKTHYVLEYHLKNPDKKLIKGMSYDCPEYGRFHLEQDRLDRVQFAIDYINNRKVELGDKTEIGAERWFDSTPAFGRDDLSGTADVIITNGTVLEVVDYKDGMNPVDAVDNPQMEIYGACALHEMVNIMGIQVEQVRLTIIQPKLRVQGQEGISTWDMPANELFDKIPVIRSEAIATDDPNAPLVSGEDQCKYCPAKGGCLQVNQHVMDAIGVSFQSVDLPKEVAEINPEKVTDEKLKDMVDALPLLRQLAEVVEAEALRRFEAGQPIKGLKLIRGRGSRTWAKDNEAVLKKLTSLKIPKNMQTSSKPITPKQALEIKWVNRKKEECELTDEQKEILLDGYISVNEGKLKVVSENARGDAVQIDVSDAFKPVEPVKVETETQTIDELPDWLK